MKSGFLYFIFKGYCGGYLLRISDTKSIFLGVWEEAVGLLVDVRNQSLVFEGFIVDLIPCGTEFICCFSSLIGESISVLRTDSKDRQYRMIVCE